MRNRKDASGFSARPSADPVRDFKECAPLFRGLEQSSIQAKAIVRGGQPWLLTAGNGLAEPCVALGVLVRRRLRCSFGVTLDAAAPAPPDFWLGLREFARRHAVTDFWVESIGAPGSKGSIPTLPNERQRFANIKLYMIHLQGDNPLDRMATNHRRNIAKSQRNAVELVELPATEAILAHRQLGTSSLVRRKARGEPTGSILYGGEGRAARLLASGAARLYQASHSGNVVSSKLVLVLGEHAYYLSGGTAEEGMRLGASHFLMYQIICALRAAGVSTLNLEVASIASGGLGRFKEGFGAEILSIERVHCDLASPAKLVRNFTHHLLRQSIAAGTRLPRSIGNQQH